MTGRRVMAAAIVALLSPAGVAAQGIGGVLSEAKGGVLAHDVAFLDDGDEEGVDVNAELLFRGVEVRDYVVDVRPHLGASVSTARMRMVEMPAPTAASVSATSPASRTTNSPADSSE